MFSLSFCLLGVKGSPTYPSWIGLPYCGGFYWIYWLLALGVLCWLSRRLSAEDSEYAPHVSKIMEYSFLSGTYAGFGLGGGLFLIRLCQELRMNPLESSSTVSLCIFLTALLNAMQSLMAGAIALPEFLQFYLAVALGSFVVSHAVSGYVRRHNRYSLLQFMLVSIVLVSMVSIPYSAFMKWRAADYDSRILFGFKAPC
jgi:uncharacterized membrane protein YfcA